MNIHTYTQTNAILLVECLSLVFFFLVSYTHSVKSWTEWGHFQRELNAMYHMQCLLHVVTLSHIL